MQQFIQNHIYCIIFWNSGRMHVALALKITLMWFDQRLTFQNLKEYPDSANLLSQQDMNEVSNIDI